MFRRRTHFPTCAVFALFLAASVQANAQEPHSGPWVYQDGLTKENLRGIVNVGGGIVWASGAHGIVRRTEDAGYMWQTCAMPPDAQTLDFRGIQAWDENNAVVMSSGPGSASRIYKTTDGCQTWKVVFQNPLKDGFYDALHFIDPEHGVVLGDPIKPDRLSGFVEGRSGSFPLRLTNNGGYRWIPVLDGTRAQPGHPGEGLGSLPGEAFFAASNSSMASFGDWLWIGTSKGRVLRAQIRWQGQLSSFQVGGLICSQNDPLSDSCPIFWQTIETSQTPIVHDSESAGIFSIAFRDGQHGMVVGGDYKKPSATAGTAAWTVDGGKTWTAAAKPPHGYRSSVAWDAAAKAWIAVGPNGSDISYDDGRTWSRLDDGNWNALSLPWVVGPDGRVAKLGSLPRRK